MRRAEGGGRAPALLSWQSFRLSVRRACPATGEILAPCAGPRRPAARAGVETGLWRAVLRMRGRGLRTSAALAPPDRQREDQARVGECHPPFTAARVGAVNKRHAAACRMRTPSGNHRARARIAPPPCMRLACTRIPTNLLRRQPARGPPDPLFLSRPRRSRARDCRLLPISKSSLTKTVLA